MGEKRGMKALEAWCRRVTDGHRGVQVDNMTTSWRNGLAFCALIHHFRPDLIDFDSLDKDDIFGNNDLAFRTAEHHLGIPALLDAEDMVQYEVPDRLSILTYLSQFYQTFASNRQGSSPNRTVAKRPSSSPEHVITAESPPAKIPARPALPVRREPCAKCGLPVFIAERLLVGGHILYHRSCFRCARCQHPLNLANCYETEDGQYCCETCPDEVGHNTSDLNDKYSAEFESALEAATSPYSPPRELLIETPRSSVARSSFMSSLVVAEPSNESHEPILSKDSEVEVTPKSRDSVNVVPVPVLQSTVTEHSNSDSQPITANQHCDDKFKDDDNITKDSDLSAPKSLVKMRMKMFENSDNVVGPVDNAKASKMTSNRRYALYRKDTNEDLGDNERLAKSKSTYSKYKNEDVGNNERLAKSESTYSKYKNEDLGDNERLAKSESTDSKDKNEDLGDNERLAKSESTDSKDKNEDLGDDERLAKAESTYSRDANEDVGVNVKLAATRTTYSKDDDDEANSNVKLVKTESTYSKTEDLGNNVKLVKTESTYSKDKDEDVSDKVKLANTESTYSKTEDLGNNVKLVKTESTYSMDKDENVSDKVKLVKTESTYSNNTRLSTLKTTYSKDKVDNLGNNVKLATCDSTYSKNEDLSDNVKSESNTESDVYNKEVLKDSTILKGEDVEEEIPSQEKENEVPMIELSQDTEQKDVMDKKAHLSPVSDKGKEEQYPEELNPFGDDDEADPSESVSDTKQESTNPFGSSDEEEQKEEIVIPPVPTTKPPRPPLPFGRLQTLPSPRKVVEAPLVNLNPFWSEGDEPSSDDEMVTPEKPPVPLPRTIKPGTTPEPSPMPRKAVMMSSVGIFGSATSLSSVNSSTGGTARRKKKPAPPPPSAKEMFLTSEPIVSSGSSSPTASAGHSPQATPRRRKAKPAPLPPSSQWEKEKLEKDEANRNRQSLTAVPVVSSPDVQSIQSVPNKSTYGQWKRKKGPAPPRPVPQRRQIKAMPMQEVRRELEDIEVQQQELERQGVTLEQTIRDKFEQTSTVDDSSITPDVEDLVLQLFELVNEKNELFRRQAELMYLRRQQRLEEEHADLEYQIRCLLDRPDSSKTDSDKAREEELIQRLVEVVERRNEIVECLEMDRLREAEEDHSIHTQLGIFAAKNKGIEGTGDEKIKKSILRSVKKEKKGKKNKEKNKRFVKPVIDVDKDIDESQSEHAKDKKSKKKWFS